MVGFLCSSEQDEVQCLWRGGGAHFQVISVEKQLVLFDQFLRFCF